MCMCMYQQIKADLGPISAPYPPDPRLFPPQCSMFYRADLILAPHGAGLTNLLCARPGTAVVELQLDLLDKSGLSGGTNLNYMKLSHDLDLCYHGVHVRGSRQHTTMVVEAARVAAAVLQLAARGCVRGWREEAFVGLGGYTRAQPRIPMAPGRGSWRAGGEGGEDGEKIGEEPASTVELT